MDDVAARGESALEDRARIPSYINKLSGKNSIRGNSVSAIFFTLKWEYSPMARRRGADCAGLLAT